MPDDNDEKTYFPVQKLFCSHGQVPHQAILSSSK